MPKISEPEFAHVLLRYTHIDDDEREIFVQRVKERMPEEKVMYVLIIGIITTIT